MQYSCCKFETLQLYSDEVLLLDSLFEKKFNIILNSLITQNTEKAEVKSENAK